MPLGSGSGTVMVALRYMGREEWERQNRRDDMLSWESKRTVEDVSGFGRVRRLIANIAMDKLATQFYGRVPIANSRVEHEET